MTTRLSITGPKVAECPASGFCGAPRYPTTRHSDNAPSAPGNRSQSHSSRTAGCGISRAPDTHIRTVRPSTPNSRAAANCDSPSRTSVARNSVGVIPRPPPSHDIGI
jgi:hypothetical protein